MGLCLPAPSLVSFKEAVSREIFYCVNLTMTFSSKLLFPSPFNVPSLATGSLHGLLFLLECPSQTPLHIRLICPSCVSLDLASSRWFFPTSHEWALAHIAAPKHPVALHTFLVLVCFSLSLTRYQLLVCSLGTQ
jgi:hypothetical protein